MTDKTNKSKPASKGSQGATTGHGLSTTSRSSAIVQKGGQPADLTRRRDVQMCKPHTAISNPRSSDHSLSLSREVHASSLGNSAIGTTRHDERDSHFLSTTVENQPDQDFAGIGTNFRTHQK